MDELTLPIHPRTGLTAIGFTRRGIPVWPVMGASQPAGGDDPDEPDDVAEIDEAEEGEEDGAESEPVVDWKAKYEEQAAALEASQAKLHRARAQAKALREAANVPAPTPPTSATRKTAPPKPDPEPVVVQDTAEVERWQVRAVQAEARSQLISRGCDPDLVDAPLSRLRVSEIDWDGDDPILDEYLDAMEERYPKLFAKPEPVAAAPRPGGVRRAASIDQAAGNGARGRTPEKEISFGERLWLSGQGDIRAPRRRA